MANLGTLCASVQLGGFDAAALSTVSFWKHARSHSDHEWRRAVDRAATIGFGFGFGYDFS